jgi:DNA (cytosine-5)-methyltransferase 1
MANVQSDDGSNVVPSRIRSTSPLHEPRALTAAQRHKFRESAKLARDAKSAAMRGDGPPPLHPINEPRLDAYDLMPEVDGTGLRSLSLFSGGGGLDIGFERAGYSHVASYEILDHAAATLMKARPDWTVFGGESGDVRHVDWRQWRKRVDVLHGGPPCQPFSHAGRQRGHLDPRDMWPEFVRATLEIMPLAFVGENVSALSDSKFSDYVQQNIVEPLQEKYTIVPITLLHAANYGVPQVRRRVFFVGFRSKAVARRYQPPSPTHNRPGVTAVEGLQPANGIRWSLGLPDIGFDDLSPTIRSTLNGPRNTTSILNSVSAKRKFEALQVWPNGVAATREAAHRFIAPNGHFRLSVPDVALIQGFPDDWPFYGATYQVLGQIGNAVPPPLGYRMARSVAAALTKS